MKLIKSVDEMKVFQSYFIHNEKSIFSWTIVKILEDRGEHFLVKIDDKPAELLKKDFLEDSLILHLDNKEFQMPDAESLKAAIKKDKRLLKLMLKSAGIAVGTILLALLFKNKRN